MRRIHLMSALALAAAAAGVAAQGAGEKLAVVARKIVTGTAADVENGALLLEDGRIAGIVAATAVPAGYRRVERGSSVLAPGLVDVASLAGAVADLDESASPVDPDARVADGLNLDHRDFRLLVESGVTAAVVLPGHANVVGGAGAVVKTAGSRPRLLADAQPLKLSLGREAAAQDRYPTSFMALRQLVRETFDQAKRADAAETPLGRVLGGRLPAVVWAQNERELRAVAELRETYGFAPGIVGGAAIREALPALEKSGLRVALAALELGEGKRRLTLPKVLEDAGLVPAFYAESPRKSADSLRVAAALAARHGLALRSALRAITLAPAEMAGVGARIGTLEKGKDADFMVLGGEPLDLAAPLEEVWIGGERVHKKTTEDRR